MCEEQNLTVPEVMVKALGRVECNLDEQICLQAVLDRAHEMCLSVYDLSTPLEEQAEMKSSILEEAGPLVLHIVDCICRFKKCWCHTCILGNVTGLQILLRAGFQLEDASAFAPKVDTDTEEMRLAMIFACSVLKKTASESNGTKELLH